MEFLKEHSESLNIESLREEPARVRRDRERKAMKSQVPHTGSPRVPVILIEYKDKKFKDSDPSTTFEKFFMTGRTSAYRYFEDQSNGQYTPSFDVYGPYTLSQNRVAYGGNDLRGNDKGVGRMVAEGAVGLDSEIDYSLYDNDGDGECDVLIVLYAGDGEASSYDPEAADAVWPCQWGLEESDYGRSLTLDDVRINKFAVFNELNGTDRSKIDGVGTFCHEFSHCLGLPDFYDTTYSGHFGMGSWSLMDFGSYNNDTYTPAGYSAYEKAYMGWMELEEGNNNTHYVLPVLNSGGDKSERAVKLTNSFNKDEYFILENRRRQGWDEYLPADGLFIYHVTYDKDAWNKNIVNASSLQRMTPVPADNNLMMDMYVMSGMPMYKVNEENQKGDLWPYGENTSFTDDSAPAAKVNTGSLLGKPVTEIEINPDGSVSFWVMKGMVPALSAPVRLSHKLLSPSSVELKWDYEGETDCRFTVELNNHYANIEEHILTTLFDTDDHGWSTEGFASIENGGQGKQAIRIGTNKENGRIGSPVFAGAGNGIVKVKVTAKYYSGDGSSVKIAVVNEEGEELVGKVIDLTSSFEDYSVSFSGLPDENLYVALATIEPKKRLFIYGVEIYTGDEELMDPSTETGSLVCDGIDGVTVVIDNLKEGEKYDWRVKSVPFGTEDFKDSEWSVKKICDLSAFNNSGVIDMDRDKKPEVYFTLDGIMVDHPTLPGIYIVKKGDKVKKLLFH